MINVAIWGTERISFLLKDIIEKLYNKVVPSKGGEPLNVLGYIDSGSSLPQGTDTDKKIYSVSEIVSRYNRKELSGVIIPIDLYIGISNVVTDLTNKWLGIDDIYLFQRSRLYDSEHIEDMIMPFLSMPYLAYLEYHVADHCNLKCRACEHYSGLVDKPVFPVFDDFEKQMYRLKEIINDIGVIRVLGGEPLLNKELDKYLSLTRKLYPAASICVVTNALLIKTVDESLFEVMKRENIYFSISHYPPLKDSMKDILNYLQERGVEYIIFDMVKEFTIKQTLNKQDSKDYFYRCLQAKCNNFYEGKLAACFFFFMTSYFNEAFKDIIDSSLPTDGYIDIMNPYVSTEDVKKWLMTPFERCRYCKDPISVEWSVIGKEKKLTDWIQD